MIHNTKTPRRRRAWAGLLAGTALLSLAACATAPEPREQMALGRAAVERVSGPGAADAPAEVATARDKIARANRAYAEKDYALARQLAEQAEADATLAEARARDMRSSAALQQVRASITALRAEMARP